MSLTPLARKLSDFEAVKKIGQRAASAIDAIYDDLQKNKKTIRNISFSDRNAVSRQVQALSDVCSLSATSASTKEIRTTGDLATFKNEASYFWIVDAREYNNNGKLVDGTVVKVDPEKVPQAAPGVTPERKATGVAKSFSKPLAGTYTVTAESGLHIRNVAGSKTGSMTILPYGTKVRNYGYYTEVNGVAWLYIQVTYQGIKYTGFSSGAFLSKI